MRYNKYLSYAIWLLSLVAGIVLLPVLWYVAVDWRELKAQYIPLGVAALYDYSFIRLKTIYCKPLFQSFLEKKPQKSFFSNLKFLFGNWAFWVESAALVMVFLVFPIEQTHPQLAELYFDLFQTVEKLKILKNGSETTHIVGIIIFSDINSVEQNHSTRRIIQAA